RRQPVSPMVAKSQEMGIEQLLFVVPQRLAVPINHTPARAFENSLRRRGDPLRGRAEARIDVRRALRDEADLQRASHRLHLVRTELREVRAELAARVAAAADDARAFGSGPPHLDRLRLGPRVLAERADSERA